MDPVTGIVEKKVAEGAFNWVRKRLSPNAELQKELEAVKDRLEAAKRRIQELQAQFDVKKDFERRKAELQCLSDDDSMYRQKDGTGPYYCPLCLNADNKFIPLTHGTSDGSHYCSLHKQYFETLELRNRRRNNNQQRNSGGGHFRRGRPGPWS
jgi:TolA-binding protein